MFMFTFTLGAVCAVLAYLASVLLASGLRLERDARVWRLLQERQPFFLDALTDTSLDPLLLDAHQHALETNPGVREA